MISPELIPEHIAYSAAKYLDEVIEDYFKDPKHQKDFEIWQQGRKERDEKEKSTSIIVGSSGLDHSSACMV